MFAILEPNNDSDLANLINARLQKLPGIVEPDNLNKFVTIIPLTDFNFLYKTDTRMPFVMPAHLRRNRDLIDCPMVMALVTGAPSLYEK